MSKFSVVLVGVLLAFVASTVTAGESKSATLVVEGMTCASCPIKTVLKKVPGVSEANVNYKTREAQVEFDPDKVQVAQLAKVVTDIGFPATVKK
ncbi:MAG: heavy metal-associated domain-containing protein [Betaproteobacteria bacterium]